jgi:hypothetical protein
MARATTRDVFLGTKEVFVFSIYNVARITPRITLQNVISMAGISELFVTNLANTVADAKQSSARIKR